MCKKNCDLVKKSAHEKDFGLQTHIETQKMLGFKYDLK